MDFPRPLSLIQLKLSCDKRPRDFQQHPPLALLLGARRHDQYRSDLFCKYEVTQHGPCENNKTAPPEVKSASGRVWRQHSGFLLESEVLPPAKIANKMYFIHCHNTAVGSTEHRLQTSIQFHIQCEDKQMRCNHENVKHIMNLLQEDKGRKCSFFPAIMSSETSFYFIATHFQTAPTRKGEEKTPTALCKSPLFLH